MSFDFIQTRPRVSPILEWFSVIMLLAGVLGMISIIFYSYMGSKELNALLQAGLLMASVLISYSGWRFNRHLTYRRDEWDYRKSAAIIAERELVVEDQFVVSLITANNDTQATCLYSWIFSRGQLYMLHPYEEERFVADRLANGSVIRAKLVNENDQLKIIEYAVVTPVLPASSPNNLMNTTGHITEKYFGFPPNGLTDLTRANFPGIISDARIRIGYSANLCLSVKADGIHVDSGPKLEKCFVRVNGYFEQVTGVDFLQFRAGDKVMFIRNEGTGISVLMPG